MVAENYADTERVNGERLLFWFYGNMLTEKILLLDHMF